MQKDSKSFQKKNQIRKQQFPWKYRGSRNGPNSETRWSDWLKLWVLWILVTTVGWVAGVSAGLILGLIVLGPPQGQEWGLIVFGFSTGSIISVVLVGLGQWWTIRQYVRGAARWTLATVLGYGIDWLVLPYTGILNGMGTGVSQWLVLRHSVKYAGWWILANVASWVVTGFLIDAFIGDQLRSQLSPYVHNILSLAISRAMSGTITGAAMVLLLAYQALLASPTNTSSRRSRKVETGLEDGV